MSYYLGIDPGISGAWAVIDEVEALGGSWPLAQWWLHDSAFGKLVLRDRRAAGAEV